MESLLMNGKAARAETAGIITNGARKDQTMNDLIKREDAIEALGEEPYVWTDDDEFAQGERSQWITDVSALKAVPSADRPTVDKDYLMQLIQEAVYDGEACAKLLDLVDRPQGEWINDGFAHRCSECGKQGVGIEYYNFCPNCGAKMKGVDNEQMDI